MAAPRCRQRCPQGNPRAGLTASAPRRRQRFRRRRRGARLARRHPSACQVSGGGARHRYFGGEVSGRSRGPRPRTNATADAAGRAEHADRAGSRGSWSQRSFAGEAANGGAVRWPFAPAARGSRPVRWQRAAGPPGRSRYIPAPVRREVWRRDRCCCSYVDPHSGRRCGSRFLLELDHIVPFALGGSAEPGNLRCAAHHRFRHRKDGPPPDAAT